tara:strand:- start:204 stop:377 length:174 start_codon:yes stop_codon:yes gene_type:complete
MKQGIDLKDAIDALTDLIIGKKTKSSTKKTTSRKKTTKSRTRKKQSSIVQIFKPARD